MIIQWLYCVTWLFLFAPSNAVKEYLFKKCEQNGFCHRNRHFASEISKSFENYEPKYQLDRSTFVIDEQNGLFNGIMQKQLNDGSFKDLVFEISIVEDYNLRFKLDERDRKSEITKDIKVNPERYNEASKWAFNSELTQKSFSYQILDDEITMIYGENNEYESLIKMHPFRITVFYNSVKQIVLNDRDFLNLEHYRENDEFDQINVSLEESKFNSFVDTFKDSKSDTLPLGPESVGLDFTFVNYTHVYGIPEHSDSFSLKDTTNSDPYRLFNVDIFEYEVQSKLSMYGSIPLMIAVKEDVAASVFWINSADTYIDIKKNLMANDFKDTPFIWKDDSTTSVKTHWMSENGIIDVILSVKPTPMEISKAYSDITGSSTLPNLFSIGYHQCRWNYNNLEDLLEVHSNFDKHEIPYDTIWLDIEYTDEKKFFTWDKSLFPNPDKMMSILDETRRQLVVIVDPHIKSDYHISSSIIDKQLGIQNINSKSIEKTYHGHCWPGDSIWIDSLNSKSQAFWNKQFINGSDLLGYSTNGHLWNDMNEPSIFNGPETSAPKDLVHYNDWEHRSIHNLYGLSFHELTYNSLLNRNPSKRPFILTRSFFAGSQRTAAMWTGDNMSTWEHLKQTVPMILTMNAVGFPFAGADVGGFFGNPTSNLLVRWYQTGIWYPFFRAHAHIDSRRREPWIAGGEYTDYMRDAIKLRYKLLPLFYTQFWKSSITGEPVMKSLLWENPSDLNGYDIDNEFFMNGLFIRPVVEENAESVDIYFPCDEETYYNFFNLNKKIESCQTVNVKVALDTIPVYVKSGNIITTKDRYRRSAQLMKYDPYTLYVVIGSTGLAKGKLYVDDGETFGYKDGDYLEVDFIADNSKRVIEGVVNHNNLSGFVKSLKDNNVTINKVIVVGSGKNIPQKADIKQGNEEWESEIIYTPEDNYFVIRNPKVLITSDWSIMY